MIKCVNHKRGIRKLPGEPGMVRLGSVYVDGWALIGMWMLGAKAREQWEKAFMDAPTEWRMWTKGSK